MFQTKIHIQGILSPTWSDWFENMQVQPGLSGETVLSGSLPDRSAVFGILSRLSNLGIPIISVNIQEKNDTGPPA